jgi:hypothetical protein
MVFEGISIDFITGLTPSHGNTVVMVVIDRFSKYAHFLGLPTSFNSTTMAPAFSKKLSSYMVFQLTLSLTVTLVS